MIQKSIAHAEEERMRDSLNDLQTTDLLNVLAKIMQKAINLRLQVEKSIFDTFAGVSVNK